MKPPSSDASSENTKLQPAQAVAGYFDSVIGAAFGPKEPAADSDTKAAASNAGTDKSDKTKPLADASGKTDNRWQVDQTDKAAAQFDVKETTDKHEKTDILRMHSVQAVSQKQFKQDNPQLEVISMDHTGSVNYVNFSGVKEGGWRIDAVDADGSVKISRDVRMVVKQKADHSGLLETLPGVPDEFAQKIGKKIEQVPAAVRELLLNSGYKVVAAPTVVDAIPSLKAKTYRAWSKTFDYSDGTHDAERRLIVAPMKAKNENGNWADVDRDEVVIHQFGHASDAAYKANSGTYFSDVPEFLKAYTRDLTHVPDADKEGYLVKYLGQPGSGGPRETFAQLFGLIVTGPENPEDRADLERLFPESKTFVQKQLDELNSD